MQISPDYREKYTTKEYKTKEGTVNQQKKKLRDLRQERHLRQVDLWLKSGIAASRISLIENGKTIPSKREMDNLAAALGVMPETVDWPQIA